MSTKRKSVKDKKQRKQVNYFLNFLVAVEISSKSIGFSNKNVSLQTVCKNALIS